MFKKLKDGFKALEYGRVGTFGNDISTPRTRRQAVWHFQLFDHAFLRALWTNRREIAPGVWRSNQPSPRHMAQMAAKGIKTVLSLRGEPNLSFFLLEKEACAKHGITLTTVQLGARSAGSRTAYLQLLDTFEKIEKPLLIHCKSGADRAGLASALWLLHMEGRPLKEARKQLSLRFMHLKSTKTGILDHILDQYGAHLDRHGPTPVRDWIANHYDPKYAQASFKRYRKFP